MSVSNHQKTVSPAEISCGGTAAVTLSFDAVLEMTSVPADIILIMDRSQSMDEWRMDEAKKAAWGLVRTIEEASGSTVSGRIANGSRMGLVSFSTTARWEAGLTYRSENVTNAISKLVADGYTNHSAAFESAERMMGAKGVNRQLVVMFTDGHTHNEGVDPVPITDRMKAAGMEIFCIGLVKNAAELYQWASEPTSSHVEYTSDPGWLGRAFQNIALGVVRAGARRVVIEETLNPEFQLVRVEQSSIGKTEITGPQNLTWTIPEIGIDKNKSTATLTFLIRHNGIKGGLLEVNRSLSYRDMEGQSLVFPSPAIQVNCQGPDPDPNPGPEPDPAPEPVSFLIPGCQDSIHIEIKNVIVLP